MANINPISFIGGRQGEWKVTRMDTIIGEPMEPVSFLTAHTSHVASHDHASWILRGTNNHARYSTHQEIEAMKRQQEGLGRAHATHAVLIPIRKNSAWWELAQDERRRIFEEESQHIALSMEYLPAIARRLYHSRDLGEPFDFLTWFEFAPEHETAFNTLVAKLRATKEWTFVEHEIEIRLVKEEH